ncbi:MAG: hypothetical protein KC983_12630, partial [Phycisphaerales bacterium]|nr:hypothetical protein [Phycisphaerales bacterium]
MPRISTLSLRAIILRAADRLSASRVMLAGLTAAATLFGLPHAANAQLRIVNYNVAKLIGDTADMENVFAEMHLDATRGFAVPVSIFVFQEVEAADFNTLSAMVNDSAPPGVFYIPATYTNFGEDTVGAQAAFFRTEILAETLSGHADLLTGGGRQSDRWLFRPKISDLVQYDNPAAEFYIYGTHLKAGSTQSDVDLRETGVNIIRADADALGSDRHIIYCGDMNFAFSSEAGFQAWFAAGSSQAIDALGGTPWGGATNAIKHTQSPRSISVGGLTGGAMDDRFDFQLFTSNFTDGVSFDYIPGTYRAFGNDGMHYDLAINAGNNFYFPGELARSNALASNLHDASDHVPVIVDYAIPPALSLLAPMTLGRSIVGASGIIPIFIQNVAPVDVVEGGADMAYTLGGANGLAGNFAGTAPPLGPLIQHNFTLDTSTPGALAPIIVAQSTTPGTHNAFVLKNLTATIVDHSNASFSDLSDDDALLVEDTRDADTGVVNYDVDVHNFGFTDTDEQALLDIDAVGSVAAPFAFTGGATSNIGSTPATLGFTFDTAGLAPDVYESIITIDVSDENLAGATADQITLTLRITINGKGAPP